MSPRHAAARTERSVGLAAHPLVPFLKLGPPVLCDFCGGNRSTGLTSKGKEVCEDCINGTHDFPPVPGRRCENPSCRRPLPRRWTAVYCCLPCALDDA